MYDTASELYNDFLRIYYHKYFELPDDKKIESKYDPKDLFLDGYNYSVWSENAEVSTGKVEYWDLPLMLPLEGDQEEVKEGRGLKILAPNKLLSRLPILLAQIKAGNAYKLKRWNQTNVIFFALAE